MSLLDDELVDGLDNIIHLNLIIKFINNYCYSDITNESGYEELMEFLKDVDGVSCGHLDVENMNIGEELIKKSWTSHCRPGGIDVWGHVHKSLITIFYSDTFIIDRGLNLNPISKLIYKNEVQKAPILIKGYPHKSLPEYIKFNSGYKEIICINCNKELLIPGYNTYHIDFDASIKINFSKDTLKRWVSSNYFNYGII